MKYERVRVGEILELRRRPIVINPEKEYQEIGIRSFGKGIFHKPRVIGADLGSKRVFMIAPGDLVISNVFAWEGAVAIASDAERGKIGSHRFMTFVPTTDRILTSWAMWFFRSEPGLELIHRASPGSAGRNRTLAVDRFEALEIPLPPVDEQTQVADRLDRISADVSQLRTKVRHRTDLHAAFEASLASRPDLDDSTKRRLGWRQTSLAEVLGPSTNTIEVHPDSHYHIAGIYSFGRGLINRGEISGTQTAYKTLTSLVEGDVLISKLGAWEGAVAVADAVFEGFCVSPEFPTFSPDRQLLLPAFFRGIARSPDFWRDINASTRGSMARRKRITGTQFLATRVWLPPIEAQTRVVDRLDSLNRQVDIERCGAMKIESLLPANLNEAFSHLKSLPATGRQQ